MSTLAYVWVEHCNNIASCGEAYSEDKYFLTYLSSATVFVLNYHEHVEFLDVNGMYLLLLFIEL